MINARFAYNFPEAMLGRMPAQEKLKAVIAEGVLIVWRGEGLE